MRVGTYFLAFLAAATLGCFAPVGVSGPTVVVPTDTGAQCRAQCSTAGMELSAVVIMANHVGCVCQPAGSTTPSTVTASAAAQGAMVTIMLQEQEQQQQRS